MRIAEETANPEVEAMDLDLASLSSVRSFAGALARRDDLPPLRALVCNAGVQVVSGTSYTEDGFEETFGVNHLGHFLPFHGSALKVATSRLAHWSTCSSLRLSIRSSKVLTPLQ